MLNIAFSTLGTPDLTLQQVIDLAAQNRYDGVELRALRGTTDLASCPEFASPQHIAESSRRLAAAGLAVPCLDTSVHVGPEAEELGRQVEMTKICSELAAGLGAPYLRVFAGPPADHPTPSATYPAIAEGLDAVAETAARAGTSILVETHGTLSRSQDLIQVLDRTNADARGVVWDVVHTHRAGGEPVIETHRRLQTMIKHVHVRDCASMDSARHDFVPAGEGVMPLDQVIRLLLDSRFDGYVSFEWEKFWVPELADGETVIPQFATFMDRYRQ